MFYLMLLTVLFLPLIMIVVGNIFKNNPPRTINHLYGYRTKRSMKNQKSWEFANKKMGEYWFKFGIILLPLSVVPLFLCYKSTIDTISIVGTIILLLQLIPIFISIYLVEKDLSKL